MTRKTTREQVRELTDQGLTVRQISTLTGVSTQRIYQILSEERKKEAVNESA